MKGQKLWGKLKGYLLEHNKYVPEIKEIDIFKKEIIEDVTIYNVDGIIIKLSNKQLQLDKQQLNEVNDNEIDNTGSFYWPSEFILTQYLLKNLDLLQNNAVIELGAGRSGFCGLVLAKKGYKVTLTDGNATIVNFLEENAKLNDSDVLVEVMKWQSGPQFDNTVAVISDCFFFENYHNYLVETLKRFKLTIGAAPSRGGSLERFIKKCEENQIKCKEIHKVFDTSIILFQ